MYTNTLVYFCQFGKKDVNCHKYTCTLSYAYLYSYMYSTCITKKNRFTQLSRMLLISSSCAYKYILFSRIVYTKMSIVMNDHIHCPYLYSYMYSTCITTKYGFTQLLMHPPCLLVLCIRIYSIFQYCINTHTVCNTLQHTTTHCNTM